MNTRGLGLIRPRMLIGRSMKNTRLVALASCHFVSGYRIDYQAIGKSLQDAESFFVWMRSRLWEPSLCWPRRPDLLAADAHKWLLGPCGAD